MGSQNRRTHAYCRPSGYLRHHDLSPAEQVHRRTGIHHSRNRHAPNNRRTIETTSCTSSGLCRQSRSSAGAIQFHLHLWTRRTPHPLDRCCSRKHCFPLPPRTHRSLGLYPSRRSILRRTVQRRNASLARPLLSGNNLPPRNLQNPGQSSHRTTLSLYTAMAEQVTLNILSISILGLTGAFWIGVT